MQTSTKTMHTLTGLGLTEYQAKAYVAILLPKEATAEEVSVTSGVPRSKVYQTLKDLQTLGWVKVRRGRPLRFKPVDPRSILEDKFQELSDNLQIAQRELLGLYRADVSRPPDVELVYGPRPILEKELDMIKQAQRSISLVGSLWFKEELETLVPWLFRKAEKGVSVRVVSRARVNVDKKTLDVKEALAELPCEKEFREKGYTKTLVIDEEESLLIFSEVEKDQVDSSAITGMWTRNKEIPSVFAK